MTRKKIALIQGLIEESEQSGPLYQSVNLTGFSGGKLIGALQRIACEQARSGEGCYLEVGVFQGLTLLSVASVLENMKAYGIDNFAYFDRSGTNLGLIHERAAAERLTNYHLIEADYEDALEGLKAHIGDVRIGTYFIDGPHDYRSQLMCLLLARPYLSEHAVIIVDDSNCRHVRQANRDFLVAHPEFKLLFDAYTECHPANMDAAAEAAARKGWWDGVNIIVRDPENVLPVMYPDTFRDRQLYENEHVIHCGKYGFLATETLFLVQYLMSLRFIRAGWQFWKFLTKFWNADRKMTGKYQAMNTFSEDLPKSRFNKIS